MNSEIPHLTTLAEASILDFLAYGLIAMISFILYHQKTRELIISTVIMGIVMLVFIMTYGSFAPNTFKYPPESQYILWGLFVVCISFLLIRKFSIKRLPRFITFISANSMWVYFWHLIPVNFIKHYPQFVSSAIIESWWIKWILIVLFASFATYVQNILSKKSKDILEKVDLKLITK